MRTLTVAAVAAALFAAGCGGSDPAGPSGSDLGTAVPTTAQQPTSRTSPPTAAPSQRLRELPAWLKFEATTLEGKPFSGANLAEQPVVFWFWAPWCSKCLAEGPAVAKAAENYQGRVAFVGVAGLDGSTARMRRFVERTGTGGLTQLDDRTGRLYKHFGVTAQSSYVLLTRAGAVTRATGPLDAAELESRISKIHG
jgi:thiol-disulfide isomerase/thioredoxin